MAVQVNQQLGEHFVRFHILVVLDKYQLMLVQPTVRDKLEVFEKLHDSVGFLTVQIVQLELFATLILVLQPQHSSAVKIEGY